MGTSLILLIFLLPLATSTSPRPKTAPRFTVNLDLPPKQRWSEIMAEYGEQFTRVADTVERVVTSEMLDLIGVIAANTETLFPYPYNLEMMGIAGVLPDETLKDVVLLNILYELTAFGKTSPEEGGKACTSIVAERTDGLILHGRNLDYSLSGLRNLTITVDFQRGGKTAYTGTTFAGYVGLLTGQKPHGYTISMDERDQGKLWMNILEGFISGMGAVTVFDVRDTLANSDYDFEMALDFLSNKSLIAPSYLIMGGIETTQGAVITRGRSSAVDVWRVRPEDGEWFLVETNYDHWKPPPESDDRRNPAIRAMDGIGRANVNATNLFGVLSTPPVLNGGTIYTVVMSAAKPELYTTWIRDTV